MPDRKPTEAHYESAERIIQGSALMLALAGIRGKEGEATIARRKLKAAIVSALAAECAHCESMRDAIWQALDDMADSHCVCEETKQQLIAALAKAENRDA